MTWDLRVLFLILRALAMPIVKALDVIEAVCTNMLRIIEGTGYEW